MKCLKEGCYEEMAEGDHLFCKAHREEWRAFLPEGGKKMLSQHEIDTYLLIFKDQVHPK